MIPKIIHYCWFGRNPLPESAQKCIASWRRYFPDHEIKEWNEDNFDVNAIPYTAQAYEAGRYAFVSDYARFAILYRHGGLYFDTDVEVIRPFDDIIARGPFMGYEIDPNSTRPNGAVNPGLGMGAEPLMSLYKVVLDYYTGLSFIKADGTYNTTDAVVNITTRELAKAGMIHSQGIRQVAGITLYPKEYFNPFDDATGRMDKTIHTHSIHWYSKTWISVSPTRQYLSRLAHRLFGTESITNIRKFIKK